MSGPFDAFLSRAVSDCVNARHYPGPGCSEPHQGCGCAKDASQGAHEGPCEPEGGYGEGGATVLCTLCLAAIRADKYKPGGGER